MDNIIYKRNKFLDWSQEIRKKLRDMTIRRLWGASGMIDAVSNNNNPMTCVAFLDGIPIAWTLNSRCANWADKTIMIYVKRRYRRKGIGAKLFKNMRQVGGKYVVIHDENSHNFWTKTASNRVIIIRNYWPRKK